MGHLVAGLVCGLYAALPAHDPTRRVHDFAQLLPQATVERLETLSRTLEEQTTAQLAIVTTRTLDDKSVEEYANELFNAWGIGRRETNNGVLLLVAPNQRSMRIEVGRGLEPLLTDALCGEIRDKYLLPAFREKKYAEGIEAGANELAAILRRYPDAARGKPGSAPYFVRTSRRDAQIALLVLVVVAVATVVIGRLAVTRRTFSTTSFAVMGVVILLLAGVAAALIFHVPHNTDLFWWLGGAGTASAAALTTNVKRFRRFGPHSCGKCGTRLELLDEQADDAKLTEVQQLEEKLGSIDYDVWFCPACLHNETIPYIAFLTKYSECPKCEARAYKEGPQKVVRAATTLSAGEALVSSFCVACKLSQTRKVILPRIVVDSSSGGGSWSSGGGGWSSGGGGSSFGGGSSGGGGASGHW